MIVLCGLVPKNLPTGYRSRRDPLLPYLATGAHPRATGAVLETAAGVLVTRQEPAGGGSTRSTLWFSGKEHDGFGCV